MGTKVKFAGLILATAVLLTSPMLVWADDDGGGRNAWHQGGEWHHGQQDHMFAKILGLSDDQVKQLKDIHQKQKDAMKSVFEQMKSNREAFNTEIVKATPDMGKINDIQTQIKTIQSQMVDAHLNSILAIKKIMTPEQFAGYMALQKERKMMGHHMMGHDKFGHKDGACKIGDKSDKDHDSGSQD